MKTHDKVVVSMFRSRLTWLAGLLFLAHALALAAYGTSPVGSFLSNLIEFALGALAFAAVYRAGRRSGPFGRWVWSFVAVAIAVWTAAQGIITYYENFLKASYGTPWPSDPLIFFWVVPLFMVLFLDVSMARNRLDRVQILDFNQVIILMISAYIAYLYVPSQWVGGGDWMTRLGWDATNVRDVLLAGGLVIRALFARTRFIRSLFGRLAAFFVLYQIADLIYHYGEEAWKLRTGNPWDLLWSAPFVAAIAFASTWRQTDESELAQRTSGRLAMRRFLFLSSAFLPLPVLFVAEQLERETPILGSLLVAASLLCAASRLLITQRRRDKSEESLRHREEELKEAQRLARIGSWEWDVDSDAISWSDELYRIAHRDPNLPPPPFREFATIYPEESWKRLKPLVENAIQTGAPYELEMERVHPDGAKKWFIARGEPVRDSSGRVHRLRGTVQDITERKLAEVALAESEEHFRALSDASFEGIAYTDSGKVILANSRLAEMLGCEMRELVGSSVSNWVAPESRNLVMEHIRSGSEGTYEHFLRRSDETKIPVETRARHMNWKGKRVRVTALHDVSERKRAEQMLRDLTEGTASAVGSEFLSSLVRHTAAALHAKHTFIAARIGPGRARTLAVWNGEGPGQNFEYDLKGSPCQEVLRGTTCFHPENVRALFPDDAGLAKMGAESYLGVPLFDSCQHVIGHIAVLDTGPMPDDPQATSILGVFAARAGAELERQRALDAVQNEKAFSEAVIDSLPGFVFVVNVKGEVVRWNRNAESILGYSREELLETKTIDHITVEDREHVAEKWLEAFEKGSTLCEARVQTKDGKKVPFLLSAVRTGIGNDVYIIGTGIDITQRKSAEEALQAEKAFTEAVIDSLPGAFFVQDAKGRLVRWNKNVEEVGYTIQDLEAANTYSLIPAEDRALAASAGEKVLAEGSATLEIHIQTKEGAKIPFFVSAVRADIGGKVYIVGTGLNITERQRAEEALRESERRYREIVDHASDIIYETDRNGRFTFVNPVATRILGYSPDELIGRHYLDLVRPDVRPEAERLYRQQRKERTPSTYYQCPVVSKSGAEVWLGQHVRLAFDESRVFGFRAISRDITRQKLAEFARVESEERFRQMAENSPDLFWLFDVEKQVLLYVSPGFEKIWGRKAEELYANPIIWRDTVHPEDRDRILADFDTRAQVVGSQNEFRVIRPDGSIRWVNGRTFPVRDQAGRIRRLAGISYDVTERRLAEEALRRQEKLFHAVVEDQTEMIVRWKPDGIRTFVNEAYCRTFGRSQGELIGTSFYPLIVEEERDRIRAKVASLTPDRPTATDVHRSLLPAGKTAWHEWTDRALFDEQGRVVELQSVGRDITERKMAEEALTISEARYRTLIESAPEAIVVLDAESGQFVDCNENATKLFALPTAELLKVRPLEVSPPIQPDGRSSADAAAEYIRKAAAGEVPVFEWMHRNTQGLDIPCEVRLVRLPGTGRTLLRGSVTDITSRKQAEAALQASQEMFSKAFHSSPEPMGIMKLSDWKFLDANQAACSLIGFSRQEIVGRTGRDLGLTAASKVKDDQLQSLARGEFRDQELELKVKSGETRTVLVSLEMVEIGGERCILAQGRDVTDQRRAVNALRASDRRYRDFISHSQEGVWRIELEEPIPTDLSVEEQIQRLSNQGFIAECNDALARIFRLTKAEDLIGTSVKDLVTARDEGWQETIRSSARGHWQNRTIQFQTFDRAGGVKHLQRTEVPIVEDGQLVRIWGMTRDVTDLHNAEEAVRASERRYRLLFERSVAGVLETTFDGRLLECNDAFARIQGYNARGEMMAVKADDFYLERADGTALSALLKEQPLVMGQEFQTRRKDGAPVWMLVSASLVEHEKAESTILATAFDITQWKELGEQLRQSQKMEAVGRLAGGVAHDFNNMLQIINGYSELVIDQLPAEDPSRSHVYEIKSIVDRAAGLTRQLLAFSRQQVLAPQVMDLNAALANLSKMLRRLIGEDVELLLTEGRPLGKVKADPGQIDQVILNLAVNARDAMPHGGKLAISTSNVEIDATYALAHYPMTAGPYVLISVTDTGHGMTAETQARIFEPFFTTKETGKGTGLGLATVYGIVKQSGGFIWAESEVGKGTTFKIYLPPSAEAPVIQPEARDAAKAQGTETVLLVEDEEYVRSLVRRSLQSKGYSVLEARNGAEALRVAQQHPASIDLLITDVVMPGMSGRELSEKLVPLRPHLKTIFMSGYTDDSVLHRGIRDSGGVLLQKPFTAETLALRVRQVLESA